MSAIVNLCEFYLPSLARSLLVLVFVVVIGGGCGCDGHDEGARAQQEEAELEASNKRAVCFPASARLIIRPPAVINVVAA